MCCHLPKLRDVISAIETEGNRKIEVYITLVTNMRTASPGKAIGPPKVELVNSATRKRTKYAINQTITGVTILTTDATKCLKTKLERGNTFFIIKDDPLLRLTALS